MISSDSEISSPMVLHIAVPSPLRRCFDYLIPADFNNFANLVPGMRVKVPFRNHTTIGIIINVSTKSSFDIKKLKQAIEILDTSAVLPPQLLKLAQWASDYYHHPIGEVILHTMPSLLRKGKPAEITKTDFNIKLTDSGKVAITKKLRATQQLAVLHYLQQFPSGLSLHELKLAGFTKPVLTTLLNKGWLEEAPLPNNDKYRQHSATSHALTVSQQAAITTITASFNKFQTFLLSGITGSGKTEVYLQLIEKVLEQGKQALILIPEISLTPQTLARFQERFTIPIAVFHSGVADSKRLETWLMARDGKAAIVIGTRSAIYTPLLNPGIIIVDEEHDVSFKQQDGFRYHARDLAVVRGKMENIPVVLGTATPSLESLYNVHLLRYQEITLPERAGNAIHPSFTVLDIRNQRLHHGLSLPLLTLIKKHLNDANQVLLFLNRRGYAPTLLCHACGWVASCHRCDAHLTLHREPSYLHCHHCNATHKVYSACPKCKHQQLLPLGLGTERIEQTLVETFPGIGIARLDRDSTRRKGSVQTILDSIHTGHNQILIGTQMLAKGHHFPNVTLVAILDADSGLFSADFRASERIAQLLTQVAGRAGRADKAGEVVIQTHNPDHPLLQSLIHQGYEAFSKAALVERKEAMLPPFTSLALLRAEATSKETALNFLSQLRNNLAESLFNSGVEVLGPIPAPMERRAGHFRAHLLLHAKQKKYLHSFLPQILSEIANSKQARQVRWSLDVDPVEMM